MLEILLTLAQLFRASGYELYMVGGTVRDLLLHRDTPPDADLATNARPDAIKRLVEATHPLAVVTVGEQFGTIRLHYPAVPSVAPEANSVGADACAPVPSAVVAAHAAASTMGTIRFMASRLSAQAAPDCLAPNRACAMCRPGDLLGTAVEGEPGAIMRAPYEHGRSG